MAETIHGAVPVKFADKVAVPPGHTEDGPVKVPVGIALTAIFITLELYGAQLSVSIFLLIQVVCCNGPGLKS